MGKFIALHFRALPNAAHYAFCSKVKKELATADTAVKNALGTLITEFNTYYTKENALMEWVHKSGLTAKIADANKRMDSALTGLSERIRSDIHNPAENTAAAAKRIYLMLQNYGYIYNKPYIGQSGDMQAVLEHLQGSHISDVTLLGISTWVTELQSSLTAFRQLLDRRGAQQLEKPDENFFVIRREIEKIYHKIVRIVDAGALVSSPEPFDGFINKLNPEIELLNREYHHARRNIADSEPAPIPQQIYTGQPVTPTPSVLYITSYNSTQKLELGKDYNLTYRNNIKAGNAQCTIHGKGKYRGRKTVTFVIVREEG
jgi:hypothetical protein